MQRLAFFSAMLFMFFGAATLGCLKPAAENGGAETTAATSEHDHEHSHSDEHGHDHAHDHHDHEAHGPHGGHLIELDGGKFHAEWTHDNLAEQENAKNVTVYILGEDAKTPHLIAAEPITINVTGGKEPKEYQLAPVNTADGKASQFALDDPALVVDLGMVGEAVQAKLDLTIDGAAHQGALEHEHEHDHGHEHAH